VNPRRAIADATVATGRPGSDPSPGVSVPDGSSDMMVDILIVEDDEQTHAALMSLVRRMGYAPRGARTITDALSEVQRIAPQVLITDWDLGEQKSGIDIATLALKRRVNCKVVFCSGNDLALLRLQTRHLDVCKYIKKPLSLNEFREAVSAVIESR
jgi:DNA-binding NtrC family response regulator